MSRPPPETARTPSRRARSGVTPSASAAPARVTLADARGLLRLSNELHDAPADPPVRKRRLLEGLCRLLRADAGVAVVIHVRAAGGQTTVVSLARYGMTEADAQAFAAHYRAPPADATPPGTTPGRHAGSHRPRTFVFATDHCLESTVAVAGGKLQACLTLFRREAGRRPFSRRETALLELFHSELGWLYRPDVPLVSPAGMRLTGRQRQTLQLLLAGHSEKEVAAHLGVSPNTVHHYVKAIHRHFRVSSRSELLAKWVRK